MNSNMHETEKYENYKKYIGELKNEYAITFEKIELYINQASKLNSLEKNNCLIQILDTFLSGQEQGKLVKEITGLDLKKYCDNMIYGESIYIYKSSRLCFTLLGVLFYVIFMNFFIRFFETISLNDNNIIFSSMSFGIADIILIIGCICIPKIIFLITGSYFENTVRCKIVKRYSYYGIWFFTIIIYSFIKESLKKYAVVVPFSNVILILVYLTLISLVILFLIKMLQQENLEEKIEEREQKYFDRLNKQYETHVKKQQRRNKTPLDFNKFKRNRAKSNSFAIKIFFTSSIIFLILAILIGRWMLVKENIDALGIIILIIICFFDVVMLVAVRGLIEINKNLAVIEE